MCLILRLHTSINFFGADHSPDPRRAGHSSIKLGSSRSSSSAPPPRAPPPRKHQRLPFAYTRSPPTTELTTLLHYVIGLHQRGTESQARTTSNTAHPQSTRPSRQDHRRPSRARQPPIRTSSRDPSSNHLAGTLEIYTNQRVLPRGVYTHSHLAATRVRCRIPLPSKSKRLRDG